ncbi:uncharacterized protein LOC132935648 [Metopolophium dirhodum]|uniref:uncharacterized protein LOC132935648 n=1 Tax=Metopolophium dirhodum TaxID=44670 RepID=UPI0029903362|nr:uncharacterized protein LOC132935648 [Metopolophium dirhodum]
MITNRLMNERMLNQISSLRTEVATLTSQITPVLSNIPDKNFLDQFPFSSKISVLECESKLSSDSDINEKFQLMICSVGGVDAKSNIRRILSKLFTNKFAIECSWTGRAFEKDATKFRIQDLKIIAIMKSVLCYFGAIVLCTETFFFDRFNQKSVSPIFRFKL